MSKLIIWNVMSLAGAFEGATPMFKSTDARQRLDLIKAEPITGGGVLLFYKPAP